MKAAAIRRAAEEHLLPFLEDEAVQLRRLVVLPPVEFVQVLAADAAGA